VKIRRKSNFINTLRALANAFQDSILLEHNRDRQIPDLRSHGTLKVASMQNKKNINM
jgi:hypothetical protein